MSFKFAMEDNNPNFTTASETIATNTMENSVAESRSLGGLGGVFSPLAPPFQSHGGNELMNIMAQQEPRPGDIAPATAEINEDMLINFRYTSDLLFNGVDHSNNNYFTGPSRADSVVSSNLWEDSETGTSGARNGEMIDTFDFLVKSLSSANNYVSMLTREQLSVLRAIKPSLLYDFLLEVARVRSDKRLRRAAPHECAFCKNNGENEDCYSSHTLKDNRGRVTCPVLRAFHCPRCGATGERAHTIKYCPENGDNGLERSGSFASRRRASSLLFGGGSQLPQQTPSPPAPSPSFSLWNNFGGN